MKLITNFEGLSEKMLKCKFKIYKDKENAMVIFHGEIEVSNLLDLANEVRKKFIQNIDPESITWVQHVRADSVYLILGMIWSNYFNKFENKPIFNWIHPEYFKSLIKKSRERIEREL